VGLFELVPLTFPHFLDAVPFGAKLFHFLLGFLVDVIHGTVAQSYTGFVSHGKTLGTPAPKAPVEFVDGVGVLTEPIHGESGARHVVLTGITHVLNVMAMGGMRMIRVGASHQVVSLQVFITELIQGFLT